MGKEREREQNERTLTTNIARQDTVLFFSGGEKIEQNPGAEKAEIS